MKTTPHILEEPSYRGGTEIKICHRVHLNPEANFAAALMDHLAIVAGAPDIGEDSAGRAKIRLMTPAEVVERACEISRLAFEEFEKREWLTEIPAPKPQKLKDEL